MENISLENFLKDINNIREYIKHIELINNIGETYDTSTELIIKPFIEHLHGFRTEKKLFEYKAIVISLYGILEKYIEIWIKEHVNRLSYLIPDYRKLPEKVNKSHFDLSIKLIALISENRYVKYEKLSKENILTTLSSCITQPLDFKFNSDAFSPMSGNLKHIKIVESFKPLDIDLRLKLKKNENFSIYLKSLFGKNIEHKTSESLYFNIDDLVRRRNDIAHGTNIDDTLDLSSIIEYIEFLEKYGIAISEILCEKEIEYESFFFYKKINVIKGIFQRGSILGFEMENNLIKKGDFIIIKTSDNRFIKKEILEIEVNKVSYDVLTITDKIDVGINLGGGITANQQFFIKPNKT